MGLQCNSNSEKFGFICSLKHDGWKIFKYKYAKYVKLTNLFTGLSCHSNIGSNLEAIAVSDCKRVKATNLRQTCTLEYHGSWSNIPVR